MQVDFDRLCRYHEDGKIRHSVSTERPDLHVWCYSQATVYNGDWDDLTRLCRGLVTDGEGHVISRPFPKFFNWGQEEAPGPEVTGQPFTAYDKEDGTLIIVGLGHDGEVVVSTKGSFDTWHSAEARKMLGDWKPVEGSTAVFEFIHPDNRIVIDYEGRQELVLLGAVAHVDGYDGFTPVQYADESNWNGALAVPRVFHLPTMLQTVADPENGPNREGFVLVWPLPGLDGPSHRVKIKFAQYVNLHRMLSRISNVSVWEALKDGTFEALLELVPDEIYDKVRETSEKLRTQFEDLKFDVATTAVLAKGGRTLRKEQAEYVMSEVRPEIRSLVFAALDGKVINDRIWDAIKPQRDESWAFLK
jgi:RNA ligase